MENEVKVYYPKFQLEVRYTHILNMLELRQVANPFLKLSATFNIQNQGLFEEQIRLNFQNPDLAILITWDRLVLITEGDIQKITDENSQFKVFFQILEKIKTIPSFGVINNYLCDFHIIKKEGSSFKDNLTKFKRNYTNESIYTYLEDPTDIAITLEKKVGNKINTLNIGPFNIEDIDKHQLYPLKTKEMLDLRVEDVNGTYINYKVFDKSAEINFGIVKSIIKNTIAFSQKN